MISVIIPAYNAAAYRPTALDFPLSQMVDLAIVVCDLQSSIAGGGIARRAMHLLLG